MQRSSFSILNKSQHRNRLNALYKSGKDVKFYPTRANKISLYYQPGHSNPRNYLPRNRTSFGKTRKNSKNRKSKSKKSKTEKAKRSSRNRN